MAKQIQRYNNIDGLRTLAAVGIVCMHVRANIGFSITGGEITNYVVNTLIAQMRNFVQLFFMLSGFSMCCGYYEKIKNNEISLNKFYNKRYLKILPFFALIVLIDLAVTFLLDNNIQFGSLAEAFADLTLMFGFYTTEGMSVVGVGWSLGVIFGFYILFPFFVYLIWNKKRAWLSLLITTAIYILCAVYFDSGTSLTFRWMCYFVLGGLIYLYKDSIANMLKGKTWLGILLIIAGFATAYAIPVTGYGFIEITARLLKFMVGYSMMLFGALSADTKLLSNFITKFIGKVSLEIYLAHMMIFRVIEKLGLTKIAGEAQNPSYIYIYI